MRTRGRGRPSCYNKAKLGYSIIRAIADYNPATFEQDAVFSPFISDVDAFITTQSILQEARTRGDAQGRATTDGRAGTGGHAMPGCQPTGAVDRRRPASHARGATRDDWDF